MPANWVREYLSFNHRERIAVIVLIILIISVFILPHYIQTDQSMLDPVQQERFRQMVQQMKPGGPDSVSEDERDANIYEEQQNEDFSGDRKSTFYFDPNTLDFDGWKRLGLKSKTITTIRKYLSKGGHFYKPEDIGKIYGISESDRERLIPFVQIVKQTNGTNPVTFSDTIIRKKEFKASKENLTIEINEADSASFESLPGIGSKLASRIMNFRNRLGGFHSIDQIGETYGLTDSVFQKLKPLLKLEVVPLTQININEVEASELRKHPYLGWSLANAIVRYRRAHGNFESLEDLMNIAAITPEIYKKVVPYLKCK